jgi:hypothetical protein
MSDHVLRALFQTTAAVTGDDFFRALVTSLADTLSVDMAWVSECLDPPRAAPTRVRTLAFWMSRELAPTAEYAISGTPCEDVLGTGECRAYPSGLRQAFPEDAWLGEVEAESYVAVALRSPTRGILGHLAVMDRAAMDDVPTKQWVLEVIARRATAELERLCAERDREQALGELREAMAAVRTLTGLLHACAWCDRVRDTQGRWDALQRFVERHSEVSFTHGICPDCRDRVTRQDEGAAAG